MNTDEPSGAEAWVLGWQVKFHRWAQTDKTQKFEDVYNLVCDERTLREAWRHVRSNKGSKTAGVDGQTRYTVQASGEEKFLQRIRKELKAGTYRPRPVREKAIPKKSGKIRRLGIPALRDRVIQQALRLVLEPIFEADFYVSSYAYRPGRRAQDAIAEIFHYTMPAIGYAWVVEGDIRACFDNVHHGVLLEEIRKRVTDRKVLRLVRAFLKSGVMTELGAFRRTMTGTPQGGILSPLLANIYLGRLDGYCLKKWKGYGKNFSQRQKFRKKGHATSYLVRFADDFVILVKGTREQAESLKEETANFLREELHMELSLEKTRITHVTEGFDFLGYHIVLKANHIGRVGMHTYPSKESLRRVQEKVKKLTSRITEHQTLGQVLAQVNPVLRGWANYFQFAYSQRALRYLGHYAWLRMYRWMRRKHKVPAGKLRRKYIPNWTFRDGKRTLFQIQKVKVERYAYRGAHIPNPWNQGTEPLTRKHQADRMSAESKFLERLDDRCAF